MKLAEMSADELEANCTPIYRAMARAYPNAWFELTSKQRTAILRDCIDHGVNDYGEYRQNIGADNLASYADTMIAHFARR